MEIQIFKGQQAIDFVPKFVKTKESIVIYPIHDRIISNTSLGFLIISRNVFYSLNSKNDIIYKIVKESKEELYFLFSGTNPTFFNYLFNNNIPGVYNTKTKRLEFNETLKGSISFEFRKIIHDYITKFYL